MLKYAFIVIAIIFGYSQVTSAQPPDVIIDPETNAPLETLRVDWIFGASDQTVFCAEETYQVPFLSPEGTPAEWINSGAGGFQLPSYLLNFSTAGTYQVENRQDIGRTNFGSGIWSIVDGEIVFACPEEGCQVMPNGETVDNIDSPFFVPALGRDALHLGGEEIAFYRFSTSRMACRAPGRSFRLSAPAVAATPDEPSVEMPMTPDNPVSSGDNCDFSAASVNNGYGWDPVAMLSCPPLTETSTVDSDCDFSAADQNNGFGFNPVTQTSCPPL